MSRHDPTVAMRHMLEAASEATALLGADTVATLLNDRVRQLALAHLVEIVGEAAKRVPRDVQTRHLDIPWQDVIAMRNRVTHGYDTVDYEIVFQVIQGEFPSLIAAIARALANP